MNRVCISIATKQNVNAQTVLWLLRAFVQLAPEVEVQIIANSMPLQHARCEQVQRFLATRCTHLFLLDSDCVPQEQTLQKLLAYDLDIVSAPHPAVKGKELGLMVLDRKEDGSGYVQHHPLEGLQGPDVVVGCAGLLIKRSVFDAVNDPWFACRYNEQGFLIRTEDFDFCDRAHAAGFAVWADCNLAQNHLVTLEI
jgi:hypothetical protein